MDQVQYRRILEEFIRQGKTNSIILAYLKDSYGIDISLRSLERHLNKFGLRRNSQTISDAAIANAIEQERSGPGLNSGYRSLHKALRNRHGLSVSRQKVRNVLSAMGRGRTFPVARAFPWLRHLRYCPGPNFRWCEDGHDKLGMYDIYIHGCVDEYSRRIMWLRAFVTNRQVDLVASYYLSAVRRFGVVPDKVVSDFGLESTLIAQCQTLFYFPEENAASHHCWTYSVRNVTIESWWRRLRTMCTLYWLQEFKELQRDGQWNGDIVDRWALISVYLPLINADLDRTALDHNLHRIRSQRGRIRPGGQPCDLYNLPEQFSGRRCGKSVSEREIDYVQAALVSTDINSLSATPPPVNRVVQDFFQRSEVEITRESAKTIYLQVRSLLSDICA